MKTEVDTANSDTTNEPTSSDWLVFELIICLVMTMVISRRAC